MLIDIKVDNERVTRKAHRALGRSFSYPTSLLLDYIHESTDTTPNNRSRHIFFFGKGRSPLLAD